MRLHLVPVALATQLFCLAGAKAQSEAPADLLAAANQARDELDFEKVLGLADQIEATGKAGPTELKAMYHLRGEALAALGRGAEAEMAFRLLLELDPNVTLPAGSSPKLSQPFDAAHSFIGDRGRLSARCTWAADRKHVVIVVESDPAEAVATAWIDQSASGQHQVTSATGHGRFELAAPLPPKAQTSCGVSDGHGNHLLEEVAVAPPPAVERPIVSTKPAPVAHEGGHSLWTRWYLWAGAAAVSGGVGVYLGTRARNDQDQLDQIVADSGNHYYDEAEAVAARGERHAFRANVAFGVSAAFALGGAIFLVHDLMSDDPARDERLTFSGGPVGDDGAGLALGGRF